MIWLDVPYTGTPHVLIDMGRPKRERERRGEVEMNKLEEVGEDEKEEEANKA